MAETLRLDKLLAHMGLGTRKELKKMAKAGAVQVNGEVVKDTAVHVDPEVDTIEVHGQQIRYREFVYLMLNKPQGVISATRDDNHETVLDLLDEEYWAFDLFPVGRLDIDTEGLLLLTNDGQLSHRLLAPKRHVPKLYYARIKGLVTEADVAAFAKGVKLDDDYQTLPAKLEILTAAETSEIQVTIMEGKFHQVKRMFETVGKQVTYLKRIQMADLHLDPQLELGSYRELTPEELEGLRNYEPKA